MTNSIYKVASIALVAGAALLPTASFASDRYNCRRHEGVNWNNVAIGSAAVGVLGILGHNSTVATIGLVGAGYSVIRAGDVHPWAPRYAEYRPERFRVREEWRRR